MRVQDMVWRAPVTIDCGATISAAATAMADEGVGALIVVDDGRPVGVVTDRDLVTRCLATGMAPDARIDAAMSMGVIGIDHGDDVSELFDLFASHSVRRVPVIEQDRVVGVVSLDDALVTTARDLADLAGVLSTQIVFPHANDPGPVPAVRD